MDHLLQFTILLGSIITSRSAHINSSPINETVTESVAPDGEKCANETALQIEALQKEKDDLFNKINKAIDEAIPELEKTNETEAITGLQHLRTLKQQIKEIHEADSDEELIGNFSETNNNTDFRRKLRMNIGRHQGKKKGNWLDMLKKDEFYQKLIKAREKKYTNMPNVLNRQKIANEIQAWLTKKAAEKKKIQELKAKMNIDYERCPDYGKGKERNKKDKRRGGKRKVYPCCRKCCKKSYLGCL